MKNMASLLHTIKKAVRDLIAISKAVENPHAADTERS